MVVTRSYHSTKAAAMSAAQRWRKKGYKTFVVAPYKDMGSNRKYRVETEGRGSKNWDGRVYDITKVQKEGASSKGKQRYSKTQVKRFLKI